MFLGLLVLLMFDIVCLLCLVGYGLDMFAIALFFGLLPVGLVCVILWRFGVLFHLIWVCG